ncbi:uncharacterized protein LOC110376904 isoform X2 [Helicoverpa armigera]|uniref:uncharacterized protein LOC110376904 isoform X2 n=1 Tax=Helicoverpa armigera TaxID=29058 RepID=UPI000B39DC61|nr:uncharacterized protein LOC110376904 isoform X2 [Helicoverpa armigera]XP_021191222.1 uncharacterized protein LOC110376904 isoform X2 [Helicoverpa armigera]XP_047028946.1 uncharacterized protein LOC124636819 isoform X2 [Helicoverpa zea]XP_047028947.1 uncharacterized protein LOC124636819 isoform X2 [Helicoverpa zea]XP_047028948.1 uncharacterized protein LOC124636819 isoform X2 [Helicoverpa zea]
MRMASALPTLLAVSFVLCGAVAGAGDMIANVSRVRRAPQPHYSSHRVLTDEELDMTAAWKRSHWRDMQSILRREGNQKEGRDGVQCCPSVLEMVTKKGGRTPTGLYVELYEDGENQQRLFEVSCAPNVVDKPCRFVDARLYNESRCIQKYSYSYALVRYLHSAATETPQPRTEGHFSVPGSGGWSMDYVRVRAGCECQIKPKTNKPARRRHKQRKRNRRIVEDDET